MKYSLHAFSLLKSFSPQVSKRPVVSEEVEEIVFCEPADALYQRMNLVADIPVLELVGAKICAPRTPADELTRIQVSCAGM